MTSPQPTQLRTVEHFKGLSSRYSKIHILGLSMAWGGQWTVDWSHLSFQFLLYKWITSSSLRVVTKIKSSVCQKRDWCCSVFKLFFHCLIYVLLHWPSLLPEGLFSVAGSEVASWVVLCLFLIAEACCGSAPGAPGSVVIVQGIGSGAPWHVQTSQDQEVNSHPVLTNGFLITPLSGKSRLGGLQWMMRISIHFLGSELQFQMTIACTN